jgi:hypothetical protein
VFHDVQPSGESAVLRANANDVVDFVQDDGSLVRARMSKSAMIRDDDPSLSRRSRT